MVASTEGLPPYGRLSDKKPIRVLHVDDEKDFGEIAKTFLERESDMFEVVTDEDPRDALGRDLGCFDCVVSDYDMPSMDGLEFFGEVRDEHPEIPFVLFTGKGSEEVADEAFSVGVTDYFRKETGTGQFTVLANRIENTVRQVRAERNIRKAFGAIETAREGISILDDEGEFVYVNREYAETFGYDREELLGEGWEVLYTEEGERRVRNQVLPVASEEGSWEGETVYLRKDGTECRVDHVISYTDSGMICLVDDVDENV
jgi:PAS domain S-box-containing protein